MIKLISIIALTHFFQFIFFYSVPLNSLKLVGEQKKGFSAHQGWIYLIKN